MTNTGWFTSWFNTPYYHILYKDRNDKDAELFMSNITNFLQLPKDTHILDLPCGKGRHAVYLNSLGYRVTGADLSKNSITYAKQFENDRLEFLVKDMRQKFNYSYDVVMNLFTSFGYFESDEEEINILSNIKDSLNQDGVFILDFLNVDYLRSSLVKEEIKIIDGIEFNIQRKIKDGFILKHIDFYDKGVRHRYTEHVKYLDLKKFEVYFTAAGLRIFQTFGDYQLSRFNKNTSERLILLAQ